MVERAERTPISRPPRYVRGRLAKPPRAAAPNDWRTRRFSVSTGIELLGDSTSSSPERVTKAMPRLQPAR